MGLRCHPVTGLGSDCVHVSLHLAVVTNRFKKDIRGLYNRIWKALRWKTKSRSWMRYTSAFWYGTAFLLLASLLDSRTLSVAAITGAKTWTPALEAGVLIPVTSWNYVMAHWRDNTLHTHWRDPGQEGNFGPFQFIFSGPQIVRTQEKDYITSGFSIHVINKRSK